MASNRCTDCPHTNYQHDAKGCTNCDCTRAHPMMGPPSRGPLTDKELASYGQED